MSLKNLYVAIPVFLILFLMHHAASAQKLTEKGRLAGVIRNANNEALVAASVKVKNRPEAVMTNLNGEYEIDLRPGTYEIIFSYTGYRDQEITEVVITQGEVTRLNVTLEEKVLTEVIVTAARRPRSAGSVASLYNIQKNSASVVDGISIDLIGKTPDVNVAQSLRRVNGVTVLNDKFVVVRGMADRYNNFFLNGALLPSTESDKKNFSFDLIPNNLIDNIIVSKTSSPDMPADFVGGIVQVNTKEIPDKNTFFISAGSGYNTNSTGKDFMSTKISRQEYFGRVNDNLKWFDRKNPERRELLNFSSLYEPGSDQAVAVADLIGKADNWKFYKYTAMPTQSYQASIGLRKRFSDSRSLGAYVAGTYRNQQSIEDYFRGSILADSTAGKQFELNTNLSGLASVAFNTGKSKFISNSLISRTFSHYNNVVSGVNNNNEAVITYGNLFEASTLMQTRLEGEHVVGNRNIRINWSGDLSQINRDQPDSRFIDNQKISSLGSPFHSSHPFLPNIYEHNRTSNIGIFSSALKETRQGLAANLTVPFSIKDKKQSVKFGYLLNKRIADFDLSYLRVVSNVLGGRDLFYGLSMDEIFTVDNFKSGVVNFNAVSSSDYYAESLTNAGYLMLDLNLSSKFHFVGGARGESYHWDVKQARTDSSQRRKEFKVYPSLNLIYKLSDRSNIRFSYSQTVSRPDFRESAPFRFYDYRTNINYAGNQTLQNSNITNYDLRYEIFPGSEELISISAFYKYFRDPIESLNAIVPDAGTLFNFSLNQRSSTNIGVELDFRKSLDFISPNSNFFKRIFISGNGSIMASEVEIDADAIRSYYERLVAAQNSTNPLTVTGGVRKRPLVGLSPYTLNGSISYEGRIWGVAGSYNRIGKRVIFSGLSDSTDIYENPRDVIDLQISGKFFNNKLQVKLNLSDLLNQPFIQYMNNYKPNMVSDAKPPFGEADPKKYDYNINYDKTFYRGIKGSSLSLSVSYRW